MRNETFNDDLQFDRLVDGELTSIERRRLLESLDKRPDGWRRCALAFLESQSWRDELGQVALGLQVATKVPSSVLTLGQKSNKSRWVDGAKWLALAASLLLAFELVWTQRHHAIPVADGSLKGSDQVTNVTPKGSKASDALTFYVRDETGNKQAVRVPLVDASKLDNQLGMKFQSGLPNAVRDQLKDRGYDIKSKRQYAQLWLENGQPMIVPVEDTKIVPVGW